MVVLDNCVLSECFDLYADMLLRIAFNYVGNQADAEDIVQDAFMQLYIYKETFEDRTHIKHWLIRVTSNLSKNMLRSVHRKRTVPLDEQWPAQTPAQTNVLELIKKLDWKYRDALYLHYYEGYKAAEIAEIYGTTANTVTTWLKRGRDKLKLSIEEEGYEY